MKIDSTKDYQIPRMEKGAVEATTPFHPQTNLELEFRA